MSHAVMDEALHMPAPASATPAPDADPGLRWRPPLVLVGAVVVATIVYAYFWEHSRELWWWMGHDRHTHFMYGLNLAMDLRTGEFVRMFHDFDRMRVWGPIHPLFVAVFQFIGGPDHRLAVLPSLIGFVMTIWFAFLIPRRLLTYGGDAAGLLAAFLVAISPAHRAFATDCMYESLGAGLSLAVIYLYLVVLQDGSRQAAVGFGIALTVLFLHKYNYWLLVLFGLIGGEFLRQPAAWCKYGLSLCQRDRLPSWILEELKQPLNYVALVFAVAAIVIAVGGGGVIEVGKWTLSMQEPHNFVHLAYIAFFVRLAWWWRQTGRTWALELPRTLREVLCWHGGGIALWFLLPKRLSYFLWFLGPTNDDQKRDAVTFMHGLPFYLQGLQDDYLVAAWGLLFLGICLGLGLLAWAQLKPGAAAVFVFLAVATYLTCQHPMLKNRFMHSWIAAAWILGAVGLVWAVQVLAVFLERDKRAWLAGAACLAVIGLQCGAFLDTGRAQEGGLKPSEPSPLRITDTYLPALADARNPTILSNVSTRFLWTWTFIEHHRHQNFAAELKNFRTFENNPDQAKRWLETTRSDALVLIDIKRFSTFDWKTDEYVELAAFHQALARQTAWTQTERWEMPEGVSITLWRKSPAHQ
ncbi:MAG: glycosyltransferase family 39 protein [Planctomycetes bacterium]|nr:glycosyltransferase family 39 protein [Planctomycetota bacterium]